MPEPLLRISDLVAGYGHRSALKHVHIDVVESELVGIVGPNGAGKTTLLETIAGTLRTKNGEIRYRNMRIEQLSEMERRKKGLVLIPQDDYIFPGMSVQDNLEVAGILNDKDTTKKLLAEVYEIFPILKDRVKQLADTMSGGERKMLAVAMGLVSQADLIMIDEPSLGLAPNLVTKLLGSLKRIKKKTKRTLILAEQSIKILDVADRLFGLEGGEIVFSDKIENVNREKVEILFFGG
ncbi:MAG: ATP-binding cassette domain-containing protein [Spirochaetes bacterium]|nr:ATP-binding cassette domain-containing protein [Spirochaetota bacterium]